MMFGEEEVDNMKNGNSPASKKMRMIDGSAASSSAIVQYDNSNSDNKNIRVSSLPSPTMQLTGHKGSVYSIEYSPSGESCCSGGFDMNAFLWSHSDYTNYNVLSGHKNAILDLKWSCDSSKIYTASADKTIINWDANTGSRIRKLVGHKGIVNAVDTTRGSATSTDAEGAITSSNPNILVSASDDCTAKLWDARQKPETGTLEHDYQVTAVALGLDAVNVYTAGIDNLIYSWDIRAMSKVFALKGHTDTITYLDIHPQNTHLLSNSMDNTLRTWDVRPFIGGAKQKRHCKTFVGATHNAEKGLLKCKFSPNNGNMITAGSADRMVHIWDEFSTEELYLLPGHKGCINTVTFHPTENVIASGSSDKTIFIGELGQ